MNYGKHRLKNLGEKVRQAENTFSDDVNTKDNRKWLMVGLAGALVIAIAILVAVL